MCKQGKRNFAFAKRYFALYDGGLLAYYDHERDYTKEVKRHKGVPLNCTLVKLDGAYVTRPKAPPHGMKHCFILHTPEKSNHRDEFLLVCQKKKDMNIWIEHLVAQNTNTALTASTKKQKIHPYILRLRLQNSTNGSLEPRKWHSISDLNSDWLKRASYTGTPGEVAFTFHVASETKMLESPN
jgi:hypothetical protein